MNFKPHSLFDRIFEVGIILKAVDGTLELLAGVGLLLLQPGMAASWAHDLTRGLLVKDPDNRVALGLVHAVTGLTRGIIVYAALYLLAHGIVKVVLVAAILRGKLWAYPALVVVTALFMIYQLFEMTRHPTVGLAAFTVFDVLVIYLTLREYKAQRERRDDGTGSGVLNPTTRV